MAAPVCTIASLFQNTSCYQQNSITAEQQKALLVYAKVLELAAIGGTNYISVLTSTLLTDTACPTVLPDRVRAANIRIAFNNAASAGATVPTTIQDKMAVMKCLTHLPGGQLKLDQIAMWLNCKLGRGMAYPQ